MSDASLLPAKIAAARTAIIALVSTWTYDGFNVGSRVSSDEYDALAVAAVNAVDDVEAQAQPKTGETHA